MSNLFVAAVCLALVSATCFGTPLHSKVIHRVLIPASALYKLEEHSNPRVQSETVTNIPPAYWDPSREQLVACEKQIFRRWDKRQYGTQYFGVTSRGRRLIQIHGICFGHHAEEELAEPIFGAMDAGKCFFRARCSPEDGSLDSFEFSNPGRGR